MNQFKAVIFDVGGVILPQPQKSISNYAKKLGLPLRFLPELFLQSNSDNAFYRLERGELTVNEFYSLFEAEAKSKAAKESVALPNSFSAKDLLDGFTNQTESIIPINQSMLSAATKLRQSGFLTCVLTNNWIEDNDDKKIASSRFLMLMKQFFNEVIESSHVGTRKPSTDIYALACKRLGVNPSQCIFLDDLGQNLKAARTLGMKTIKVVDPEEALKHLGALTGINTLSNNLDVACPGPSDLEKVAHGFIQVKKDVQIHYVESGSGPSVIFLHGFPDFWYGWRHQLPALAAAGYRAIALDQRGYGQSSSPTEVDDFRQEELSQDVITVMDRLGICLATVVGHDWGGALAWTMALKYPDRLKAVCSVNTPFYPINPNRNPLAAMRANPGMFDYQLYFQEPGKAEKELDADIGRSLSGFLQGFSSPKLYTSNNEVVSSENARQRGGIFAGVTNIPRSDFVSQKELEFYVQAFKNHGFRGPLNWYRNYERNWKWLRSIAHRKVKIPALMITSSHDPVLKPKYTFGMEKYVTNLRRVNIKNCGHWTPQEKPRELNVSLIQWLNDIHSHDPTSKL